MPANERTSERAPSYSLVGASLRACVQWTLIGNVVYAACQWGVLIVLAKMASPEEVGRFALGLAVTAPLMLFANMQLTSLQATDAMREFRFGHYLALRLLTNGLALAFIAGLVLALNYNAATFMVILAVALAKAFEALSDAHHGLMQQHGRMDRVARSLMLKGPLSVAAMAIGLAFFDGVVGGAVSLALSWGLLLALYDVRSVAWLRARGTDLDARTFTLRWEWGMLCRLAVLALPLGIGTLLFTLSFNIPRYFVEQHLGVDQLGIFAALAYVTVIGQVLSNSLGQAAAPRLASHYAAGEMAAYRNLVLKLAGAGTLVGGLGVLVAWLAGGPILTLLYRPEYAEHTGVFVGVMTGAGLWCVATMFVYAATAARRKLSQAVGAFLVTLATLVASVVLIQGDSLLGAAAATVISSGSALVIFGALVLTTARSTPGGVS